jgi:hypothetical protein
MATGSWNGPLFEKLRHDLRAVTKTHRLEWDITSPEPKAARRQGGKDLFYPYGEARPTHKPSMDRASCSNESAARGFIRGIRGGLPDNSHGQVVVRTRLQRAVNGSFLWGFIPCDTKISLTCAIYEIRFSRSQPRWQDREKKQ